jgi:hypothetical protein
MKNIFRMSYQLKVFLEQERIYKEAVLAAMRFVNAIKKDKDEPIFKIGESFGKDKFIDITPGKRTRSGKSY